MNKFKTFAALMLLLAIGFAGCGKSEAERHRLSKKEKARLDSLDRAALKIAVMPTMDCLPIFLACDEEDFCASCPAFDIRSMEHQELYSRLYMS